VRQAREIGGVCIVSYDWLEDSLIEGLAKPAADYILDKTLKEKSMIKKERGERRKQRIKESSRYRKSFLS
jgi:hypothetical protein